MEKERATDTGGSFQQGLKFTRPNDSVTYPLGSGGNQG